MLMSIVKERTWFLGLPQLQGYYTQACCQEGDPVPGYRGIQALPFHYPLPALSGRDFLLCLLKWGASTVKVNSNSHHVEGNSWL